MSLAEKFEAFHAENPQVYTELVSRTRRWLTATGSTFCGIDMVYAAMRFDRGIATHGDSEYKLNDHHRAFYARLIMYQEADLEGVFRTRTAESDDWLQGWAARHPRRGLSGEEMFRRMMERRRQDEGR